MDQHKKDLIDKWRVTCALRGITVFDESDDDYEVAGPMITEEEEQEIRQVASDINEKAFYGKVLRAKQMIQDPSTQNKEDKQFQKLSPRS